MSCLPCYNAMRPLQSRLPPTPYVPRGSGEGKAIHRMARTRGRPAPPRLYTVEERVQAPGWAGPRGIAAVLPVYRVYTGEPPFFVLDVTDPQVKGLAGRGGVAAGEAWSLPGVLGVAGRGRGAAPCLSRCFARLCRPDGRALSISFLRDSD